MVGSVHVQQMMLVQIMWTRGSSVSQMNAPIHLCPSGLGRTAFRMSSNIVDGWSGW